MRWLCSYAILGLALFPFHQGFAQPVGRGGPDALSKNIQTDVRMKNIVRELPQDSAQSIKPDHPDGLDAQVIAASSSIDGSETLGRPRTGYLWSTGAAQYSTRLVNSSGWNQSLTGNDGRTGVAAVRTSVQQNGNGDAGAYYGMCQIGGSGRKGASHWLAQPACVILNGDVATTVPHSYLNVQEFSLSDNGRDVAGVGTVYRFGRTENAATQGEVWFGIRNQSVGTKAIDVGISNAGPINIGLDMTMATADPDFNRGQSVGLNMSSGQAIVYNSRGTAMNGIAWYGNQLGKAYDSYSSTSHSLDRCNVKACLQVEEKAVAVSSAGLRLTVVKVEALPLCNAVVEGTLYGVRDSKSRSYGASLVGGGDNHVMAYCDGVAWTIH
ncbi:hypothetical protein [Novosphingobium sp. TCA1]|uniref:hypothetical protein n=1 Tax=Novosphingobium sp. TCA1 TaxID=2682474 RepID=UPI001358E5D6|nr:hypothetical protein [Novosphingobium sp. TCA1]